MVASVCRLLLRSGIRNWAYAVDPKKPVFSQLISLCLFIFFFFSKTEVEKKIISFSRSIFYCPRSLFSIYIYIHCREKYTLKKKKLSCAQTTALLRIFYSLEPNTCNCIQFAPLLSSVSLMHFHKEKKIVFTFLLQKKKKIIILWQKFLLQFIFLTFLFFCNKILINCF